MESVGHHGGCIVKPAFGERVLAVVAITDRAVVSASVAATGIVFCGGIHVPYIAVGCHVARLVHIVETAVGYSRVWTYNSFKCAE